MKLQCNDCEDGPCNLEFEGPRIDPSSIVTCFCYGNNTAIWKELKPLVSPEMDPITASDFLATGVKVSKKGNSDLILEQYDSKKRQIIPAEPKVLSAEDMLCHMDDFDKNHEDDIVKYGEAMDQNGQLKQWLNHKELREAAERCKNSKGSGEMGFANINLFNVLKNLKPLNQK